MVEQKMQLKIFAQDANIAKSATNSLSPDHFKEFIEINNTGMRCRGMPDLLVNSTLWTLPLVCETKIK